MSLPVQHLSDEAITAYADGVLAPGARNRASRHIAECAECAASIADQRAAIMALRSAPSPAVPADLLARLRAVPITTPLEPPRLRLAPDGSAVFAAYGTADYDPVRSGPVPPNVARAEGAEMIDSVAAHHLFGWPEFHFPIALPARLSRRAQQLALVTVAVAALSVGAVASAAAGTAAPASPLRTGSSGDSNAPAQQLAYRGARREDNQLQLVGAVSKNQP